MAFEQLFLQRWMDSEKARLLTRFIRLRTGLSLKGDAPGGGWPLGNSKPDTERQVVSALSGLSRWTQGGAIGSRIRDSFDRDDLEEAAGVVVRAMELQACFASAEVVHASNYVRVIGQKMVAERIVKLQGYVKGTGADWLSLG